MSINQFSKMLSLCDHTTLADPLYMYDIDVKCETNPLSSSAKPPTPVVIPTLPPVAQSPWTAWDAHFNFNCPAPNTYIKVCPIKLLLGGTRIERTYHERVANNF